MTTATLTLELQPDGKSARILLGNVPSTNSKATYERLQAIDVHTMPNESEDQRVIAILSNPTPTEEFTLKAARANEIIEAVIAAHSHLPELIVQVSDELTDPVRPSFFARVRKAEGPRGRDRLITAPDLAGLDRKYLYPYLAGPEQYDDLPFMGGRAKYSSSLFGPDSPYREPLFASQRKPDMLDILLDGQSRPTLLQKLLDEVPPYPNARAHQLQQEHQNAADALLSGLLSAFGGTDVTIKVDDDGKYHFSGTLVFDPRLDPSAETPASPESDAQADSQD